MSVCNLLSKRIIINEDCPNGGRSAQAQRPLRTLTDHINDVDTLTGLGTRQQMIVLLGERLRAGSFTAGLPALIMLDLDRFKSVNDGLGPLICDHLLCRVADRLRTVVPDKSYIARISGDGFAVLIDKGGMAADVASRIHDVIRRPYAISGHAITVSASLGISHAGPERDDALSMLHAADLALHQAQRDGQDRIRQFEPSMQERAVFRQGLENDFRASIILQQVELRRALYSQQFQVHYQPQVSLADGRVTGFEALLRWHHPERGLVAPDRFIPLAEEIGLINILGEWVLRTACRDALTWPIPKSGIPLRVAVNVSPLQLRDGSALLNAIQRALAETSLPIARLEIELTETALVADIADTLAAIRNLGVDLALDDFGTGYSSLSRLHRHPFTRLKIDRSFIASLGAEGGDERGQHAGEWMIRAIASLGLGLGLATVIEGVETPHQREIARLAGCTEMQGYLASRPVPAGAVADLVQGLDDPSRLQGWPK